MKQQAIWLSNITLIVATSACSGSDTSPGAVNCGRGTVLEDGTCVVVDSGASGGDTAVGTDSGGPGDTAAPEDSARADTVEDAARDTAPPGDSSVSVDTEPETATSAGDPCPSKVIDINCSGTCGGPTANCAEVRCRTSTSLHTITSYSSLPFIVRTPSLPGIDPVCAGLSCPGSVTVAYGIALKINMPFYKNGFRVTVGAPWRIRRPAYFAPYCTTETPSSGCMYIDTNSTNLLIETTDPNAPSRNITIEDPAVKGCL